MFFSINNHHDQGGPLAYHYITMSDYESNVSFHFSVSYVSVLLVSLGGVETNPYAAMRHVAGIFTYTYPKK